MVANNPSMQTDFSTDNLRSARHDPAPYVTAFHRISTGHKPDANYVNFKAAFKADPEMVALARQEHAALAARGAARDGFKGDYEGKIRHTALSRMLAQFDKDKG
jgi:hypothetical protein